MSFSNKIHTFKGNVIMKLAQIFLFYAYKRRNELKIQIDLFSLTMFMKMSEIYPLRIGKIQISHWVYKPYRRLALKSVPKIAVEALARIIYMTWTLKVHTFTEYCYFWCYSSRYKKKYQNRLRQFTIFIENTLCVTRFAFEPTCLHLILSEI